MSQRLKGERQKNQVGISQSEWEAGQVTEEHRPRAQTHGNQTKDDKA